MFFYVAAAVASHQRSQCGGRLESHGFITMMNVALHFPAATSSRWRPPSPHDVSRPLLRLKWIQSREGSGSDSRPKEEQEEGEEEEKEEVKEKKLSGRVRAAMTVIL